MYRGEERRVWRECWGWKSEEKRGQREEYGESVGVGKVRKKRSREREEGEKRVFYS